jgi:hypothetical protein
VNRCAVCGGWSYPGTLEAKAVERLYDEGYFNGGEYAAYASSGESHRRNFLRKLRLLRTHGLPDPRDVRMLEVGSATGEFLQVAREAGIDVAIGLEVSEYGRNFALGRGLRTLSPFDGAAAGTIRDLRPNVIVGWDVWEHLPDPARTWGDLLRDAAPDALVALTTVDASSLVARLRRRRWRQYHPPTHLNYPTRESLRRFLGARDFRVVHHAAFGYYRPLREYLRAAGIRCGPARFWDFPVYVDLLDTQLVIGRRAG